MISSLTKHLNWMAALVLSLAILWPSQELRATRRERKVFLGTEFICASHVCVAFIANLEAGDFFNGIRSHKTDHGVEFRKNSIQIKTFPDKVNVTILAAINECDTSHSCDDGSGFRFDANFMKSLLFKGFWKRNFEMDTANIAVLDASRTQNPSPIAMDADWWRYEIEVRSSNVGLDESLIIEVLSPDGKLVTRFSGHL